MLHQQWVAMQGGDLVRAALASHSRRETKGEVD